jgi:hypothetical protein
VIAANDNEKSGYVYVIISNDQDAFKIGYTTSGVRIYNLQTGNPAQLSLLRQVPATKAAERAIHRALVDYKIRGEWFKDDGLSKCLLDDLLDEHAGCQQAGRVIDEDDAFDAATNAVRYYRLENAA